MDEQNRKAPAFPFSGIFMILAILGVVVLTKTPLKEARPTIPVLKEQSQQVRARLWQDPFRAVLESRSPKMEGVTTGDHIRSSVSSFQLDRLADRINSSGTGTITVLGVMVYGGTYVDDSEHRIRMRYAVLAGLRRLGYYPKSPEYLDFIRTDNGDGGQISFGNVLPFEWMERLRGTGERVLVLWINEDVLQGRPLETLTAGISTITRNLSDNRAIGAIKIIGPASSTTMIDMFRELMITRGARRLDGRKGNNIELYSPSATVDISLMREFDGIDEFRRRDFAAPFHGPIIRFSRTINTDSELSKGLLRELGLRNINVSQRDCAGPDDVGGRGTACDHIVLISEWDTFYGRMLPRTFRNAAAELSNTKPADVDTWTHRFNYLRGMDGALPGEQSTQADKSSDAKAADLDLQTTVSNLEQATGRSQYDYLRRLADGIYRLDAKLRRKGLGSVRAVGILGSDFYDKYLVLQAVKQRLPDAVYFTTDLDARFLQQGYLKWTRNMIVASTFGLALPYLFDAKLPPARENLLQGEVPPFRDSYQTSVFLTIMSAFDERYRKEIQNEKPRIFEIGRQQAYELTADPAKGTATPLLVPAGALQSDLRFLLKFAVIVTAATLLLALSISRFRDALLRLLERIRTHPAVTAALAAMLMLLAALFYLFVYADPDQEPFTLFDGISIWPTEIIRLFAAALSLYLIRRANRDLSENFYAIDREFELFVITEATAAGEARKWDAAMWRSRDKSRPGYYERGRSSSKTLKELWQRYVTMSAVIPRNARIISYIAACVALAAALMWTFGWPTTPVRGTLSLWIDKVILFVSIGSFLYLTFLVVDASRLCRDFIRTAAAETPPWESAAAKGWTEEEEWNALRLVGKRSEAVGKLIFYPLVVWFLLFLSRLRFFDNWNTPLHLATIITLSVIYAWSCAYRLRKAAELARAKSVERLTAQLVELRTGPEANIPQAEQVRFIINEVIAMRQGAFASYMQSPTVQALLVPFGGVGGITLIDMLTKMNL